MLASQWFIVVGKAAKEEKIWIKYGRMINFLALKFFYVVSLWMASFRRCRLFTTDASLQVYP